MNKKNGDKKIRLTALLIALMVLSVSVFTACGGGSKDGGDQKEAAQAAKTTAQQAQTPEETQPAEETQAQPAEDAQASGNQSAPASNPTADDARAYVQAVLDLMCTGDYDHSVNMTDVAAGEEASLRDDTIAATVASLGGDAGLSEEVQNEFADVLKEAFSKCRYTVGDAVPAEDGGYDVTVTIEPLKIYSGAEERLPGKLADRNLVEMTEEEQNDAIYSAIIEIIRENLEEPAYGEPQDVVVHYALLDEATNTYGLTEAEGEKLGEVLFSPDTQ